MFRDEVHNVAPLSLFSPHLLSSLRQPQFLFQSICANRDDSTAETFSQEADTDWHRPGLIVFHRRVHRCLGDLLAMGGE